MVGSIQRPINALQNSPFIITYYYSREIPFSYMEVYRLSNLETFSSYYPYNAYDFEVLTNIFVGEF